MLILMSHTVLTTKKKKNLEKRHPATFLWEVSRKSKFIGIMWAEALIYMLSPVAWLAGTQESWTTFWSSSFPVFSCLLCYWYTLLYPCCVALAHYITSQNLNFCISVSYLQNGENNAPMLLQIHFEIKQQPYIQVSYYSIFMQLHLQNRGTE